MRGEDEEKNERKEKRTQLRAGSRPAFSLNEEKQRKKNHHDTHFTFYTHFTFTFTTHSFIT